MKLLINQEPDTTRWINYKGRFARFRKQGNGVDYWADHWKDEKKQASLMKHVQNNDLFEYEPIYAEYLPKDRLILEAGCGTGFVVKILQDRGYSVEGLDYEAIAVNRAAATFPGCRFIVGDITRLPYADNSLGAYISLGVLEHFENGCAPALQEVKRCLDDKGVALISVPYMNHFREKVAGQYPSEVPEGFKFYQYYFKEDDFRSQLEAAGLKVKAVYPLFNYHFLKNEHPGFNSLLWNFPIAKYRVRRFLEKILPQLPAAWRKRQSHMLMYVCGKS